MNTKVAVISGSSAGIGKAIAQSLLEKGFIVVLNGRNLQKLRKAQTELKADHPRIDYIQADISEYEGANHLIQETVVRYGRLDVLINNAALATQGDLASTHPDVIRKVFEVNTIGAMLLTRMALPFLLKSKGSVIFISSIAGIYGIPMNSVYASSKGALGVFAQSIEMELDTTGVHVGLALLGFVENDREKEFLTPDGSVITREQKRAVFQMKQEEVAAKIWIMIRDRKRRIVLSPLGKFSDFCARYARWYIRWFFKWNRKRVTSESTMPVAVTPGGGRIRQDS